MPRVLSSHGLIPAIKQYILKIKNTLNVEIEFNGHVNKKTDKRISVTLYRTIESLIQDTLDTENLKKIIID